MKRVLLVNFFTRISVSYSFLFVYHDDSDYQIVIQNYESKIKNVSSRWKHFRSMLLNNGRRMTIATEIKY